MTHRSLILTGFSLLAIHVLFAQSYDPLRPPDTYQSVGNPHYWKNRKPYEGYWQQDVHYTIKANIDETQDIITGALRLVYTNNSPDDLPYVYFHLYQNAFQPGSYFDRLERAAGGDPQYGVYERNGLGTKVTSITSNGQALQTETDNTVMKVLLPQPLKSGYSVTFDIGFATYFGLYDGRGGGTSNAARRRMKKFLSDGFKHYDGVHWYPRISVYDRKFGWTTDQHLGTEFYGDFGTYDVELTFAANYVVGATGFLLNRSEVLPDDLRQKLDLKNFKDKPWGEQASVITPYDSTQRKTWKYHAENVHDFAFTADPTYRIGEAEWQGIQCIALAQESHASGWQNAAGYTAKIIQTYSEDIGMYVYHKMIVADARDGMEYPMLTLDGGRDPGYRGLLCHEVGHNWFFGQVGNNETYRAALDEGFTTWLTAYSLLKIDGDTIVEDSARSAYVNRYRKREPVMWRRLMHPYISSAAQGDEATLNTHSSDFSLFPARGAGYRNVYYKTAVMMHNLEYVLGKELFMSAMKHYFDQWKIAHPYPEDFRNSIIDFTKVDLNWFFDQWMETSKTIDYSVGGVRRGIKENEYVITLRRNGGMEMPVDLRVIAKDGQTYDFHIPNTWFVKRTGATVLPKWYGRGILNPTYEARVIIPSGVDEAIIDPSGHLADVYKLNNTRRFPVTLEYDHRIENAPDWNNYELFGRPDFWYNGYDGLKAGFHVNGNHLGYHHILHASVWVNTGLFQSTFPRDVDEVVFNDLSYHFRYKTPTDRFVEQSALLLSARRLDGLYAFTGGMEKKTRSERTTFYFEGKSMFRADSSDLNYLIYPEEWGMAADPKEIRYNNTFLFGIGHNYRYKAGTGKIDAQLRSSTIGSDYDYSYARLVVVNRTRLGGKLRLNTRTFFQYGQGRKSAPESALFLAGASPEEMMENKFVRSLPFYDRRYQGFGDDVKNFHHGGGLNLRGYAGYLVAQLDRNGEVRTVYKGRTGLALNGELEFDRLFRFRPKAVRDILGLNTYLFGDAGLINYTGLSEKFAFADLRADAGIGVALTVKRWPPLEMTSPLTVRFDFPLFLSRTPFVAPDHFQFRWVVGVERAF